MSEWTQQRHDEIKGWVKLWQGSPALYRIERQLSARRDMPDALAEIERLNGIIVNILGDNLCWLDGLEFPEQAKALPRQQFMESCSRFHAQITAERGTAAGGRTIAQLEAENADLRRDREEAERFADKITGTPDYLGFKSRAARGAKP